MSTSLRSAGRKASYHWIHSRDIGLKFHLIPFLKAFTITTWRDFGMEGIPSPLRPPEFTRTQRQSDELRSSVQLLADGHELSLLPMQLVGFSLCGASNFDPWPEIVH